MAKFDEWSAAAAPTTGLAQKIAEFDRVRRNRENLEDTEKALMREILDQIGDHDHTHVEGRYVVQVSRSTRRTIKQRAARLRYDPLDDSLLPSYINRELRYGVVFGQEVDPRDADLVKASTVVKLTVSAAEE